MSSLEPIPDFINTLYIEPLKERCPKAFKKLRLDEASFLGRGTYGVVVQVDNRAIKLTRERCDAKASSRLIGKKLKNVVRIHDVFQVDRWYVIVQEVLRPVSDDTEILVSRFGSILEDAPILKRHPKGLVKAYFREFGDTDAWPPPIRTVNYVAQSLSNAFCKLADEGIMGYRDIHDENVMEDGRGTLKVIDLAFTRTKGRYKPKTLD